MDLFDSFKNLMYKMGDNNIDEFGVDHSNFSLRDELEYNMKVANEKQNNGTNNTGTQYAQNEYTNTANDGTVVNNQNNSLQNNMNESQNNSSFINGVKNFAQNTIDAISPYTPTYYIGYGIGSAKNTYDKLNNMYNAYKQNGMNGAMQYSEPSVKNAINAANNLTSEPISDVNKHQYVSCVGSTDGLLSTAETLGGGVLKEFSDYNRKVNDPKLLNEYGGKSGVLKDNLKDLKNDITGAWIGYWSSNPNDCNELLPANYRNKKYW